MPFRNETRPCLGDGRASEFSLLRGADSRVRSPAGPFRGMNSRINFDEINRAALAALPAVLSRVLPSGKQVHREWVALNPRRVDRHLGSFKVNRFNGKWCDFATGDKGVDPISLVAYVEGVCQGEAARRLARMLGVGGSHD